jgi:hypothetical protein
MQHWKSLKDFDNTQLYAARDVLIELYGETALTGDEWLHTALGAAHNALGTELDARNHDAQQVQMTDAQKYGTTNPVLIEARINHDPYDQTSWCKEWRIAVADFLTFERDVYVRGFTPALLGPDREAFAYTTLMRTLPTTEDLQYALEILTRFGKWLTLAEQDD